MLARKAQATTIGFSVPRSGFGVNAGEFGPKISDLNLTATVFTVDYRSFAGSACSYRTQLGDPRIFYSKCMKRDTQLYRLGGIITVDMPEKPSVNLTGTVEKIIKPVVPTQPEKAQISVDGADDLYKEIRLENTLVDENGQEVKLKQGAKVEVTVEADPEATVPKAGAGSSR